MDEDKNAHIGGKNLCKKLIRIKCQFETKRIPVIVGEFTRQKRMFYVRKLGNEKKMKQMC